MSVHPSVSRLHQIHQWNPFWLATSYPKNLICAPSLTLDGTFLCLWQVTDTTYGQSAGVMATPAIWAQVTWKEVAHLSCEHWMQAPRFWLWHNTHFCHGNRKQPLVIRIKGTSLFCHYRSILVRNISFEMLHVSAGDQCQTEAMARSKQRWRSPVDPWITLIYQILARLGNGADIHWLPVDGIDKASFGNSDATDDVDPPGWRGESCHNTADTRLNGSTRIWMSVGGKLTGCLQSSSGLLLASYKDNIPGKEQKDLWSLEILLLLE